MYEPCCVVYCFVCGEVDVPRLVEVVDVTKDAGKVMAGGCDVLRSTDSIFLD